MIISTYTEEGWYLLDTGEKIPELKGRMNGTAYTALALPRFFPLTKKKRE